MTKHNILFIGLDTHKEFIEVAYIEDNRGAQPIHFGRISSAKVAIKKLIRQFESKYSNATLHFVYEAGPLWLLDLSLNYFSRKLLLRGCPFAYS